MLKSKPPSSDHFDVLRVFRATDPRARLATWGGPAGTIKAKVDVGDHESAIDRQIISLSGSPASTLTIPGTRAASALLQPRAYLALLLRPHLLPPPGPSSSWSVWLSLRCGGALRRLRIGPAGSDAHIPAKPGRWCAVVVDLAAAAAGVSARVGAEAVLQGIEVRPAVDVRSVILYDDQPTQKQFYEDAGRPRGPFLRAKRWSEAANWFNVGAEVVPQDGEIETKDETAEREEEQRTVAKPVMAPSKPATTQSKRPPAQARPTSAQVKPASVQTKAITAPAKPESVPTKPAPVHARPASSHSRPAPAQTKPTSTRAKSTTTRVKPATVPVQTKGRPARGKQANVQVKPTASQAAPALAPAPVPAAPAQAKPLVAEPTPAPVEDLPIAAQNSFVMDDEGSSLPPRLVTSASDSESDFPPSLDPLPVRLPYPPLTAHVHGGRTLYAAPAPARAAGSLLIEPQACILHSDVVCGACGRYGAVICVDGGILVFTPSGDFLGNHQLPRSLRPVAASVSGKQLAVLSKTTNDEFRVDLYQLPTLMHQCGGVVCRGQGVHVGAGGGVLVWDSVGATKYRMEGCDVTLDTNYTSQRLSLTDQPQVTSATEFQGDVILATSAGLAVFNNNHPHLTTIHASLVTSVSNLLIVNSGNRLLVLDSPLTPPLRTLTLPAHITSAHAHGASVTAELVDGSIWQLDLVTGSCRECSVGHTAPVVKVAVGAGDRFEAATLDVEGNLLIWSHSQIPRVRLRLSPLVTALAVSEPLLVVALPGQVLVFDTASPTPELALRAVVGNVTDLLFGHESLYCVNDGWLCAIDLSPDVGSRGTVAVLGEAASKAGGSAIAVLDKMVATLSPDSMFVDFYNGFFLSRRVPLPSPASAICAWKSTQISDNDSLINNQDGQVLVSCNTPFILPFDGPLTPLQYPLPDAPLQAQCRARGQGNVVLGVGKDVITLESNISMFL